jgi:hypothetical protein
MAQELTPMLTADSYRCHDHDYSSSAQSVAQLALADAASRNPEGYCQLRPGRCRKNGRHVRRCLRDVTDGIPSVPGAMLFKHVQANLKTLRVQL